VRHFPSKFSRKFNVPNPLERHPVHIRVHGRVRDGLVLQYVQEPKGDRGIYRYRRRAPTELKPLIGKSELIASLGQSKPEALKRYPATHAAFEKELEIASKALAKEKRKQSSADQTTLERYEELMDEIRALGIENPEARAQDEDEATMREIISDGIAARYPEDPENGYSLIDDADDVFRVQPLMGAAPAKPAPTLEDAKRDIMSRYLTQIEVLPKVQVSDNDVKEYYEKNKISCFDFPCFKSFICTD